MIAPRLRQLLDDAHVDYELIEHPPTTSAMVSAGVSHVPSRQMAKAILLEFPGDYLLAVLPANQRVELADLRSEIGRKPHLAREEELDVVFDDCVTGAVPPLGLGYGVSTIVDDSLAREPDIYFEAGDHVSLIHVSQAAFSRLMGNARHGQFSGPWPDDS